MYFKKDELRIIKTNNIIKVTNTIYIRTWTKSVCIFYTLHNHSNVLS